MAKFSAEDTATLIKLYVEVDGSLDRLAYKAAFEQSIFMEFVSQQKRTDITKSDVWDYLIDLRKHGRLPRKQRSAPSKMQARLSAPKLTKKKGSESSPHGPKG